MMEGKEEEKGGNGNGVPTQGKRRRQTVSMMRERRKKKVPTQGKRRRQTVSMVRESRKKILPKGREEGRL
jgi:hypothetical protein